MKISIRTLLLVSFFLFANLLHAASYRHYEGEWIDDRNLFVGIKIVSENDHYLVYRINPGNGAKDDTAIIFEPRNGLLVRSDNTDDETIVYLQDEDRIEVRFKRTTLYVNGGGSSYVYVDGGTDISEAFNRMQRLTGQLRSKAQAAYKKIVEDQKKAEEDRIVADQVAIARQQEAFLQKRREDTLQYIHSTYVESGNIASFIKCAPDVRSNILKYITIDQLIDPMPEPSIRALDESQLAVLLNDGGSLAAKALERKIGKGATEYVQIPAAELKKKVRQRDFVARIKPADITYALAVALAEYGLRNISHDSTATLAAFGPGTSIFKRLQAEGRKDLFGKSLTAKIARRTQVLSIPQLAEIVANGWDGISWGEKRDAIQSKFPQTTIAAEPNRIVVNSEPKATSSVSNQPTLQNQSAAPKGTAKVSSPLGGFAMFKVRQVNFLFNSTGKCWAVALELEGHEDLRDLVFEAWGEPNGISTLSTHAQVETYRTGSLDVQFSLQKSVLILRNYALGDAAAAPKLEAWNSSFAATLANQEGVCASLCLELPDDLPVQELAARIIKASAEQLRVMNRHQLLTLLATNNAEGEPIIRKIFEAKLGKRAVQLALWPEISWEMLFVRPDPVAANDADYFNPFLGALEKLTPQDMTYDLVAFLARNCLGRLSHLESVFAENSCFIQQMKSLAQSNPEQAALLERIRSETWKPAQKIQSLPSVFLDEMLLPAQSSAPEIFGLDPLIVAAVRHSRGSNTSESSPFSWLDVVQRCSPEQLRALPNSALAAICQVRGKEGEKELIAKIGQQAVANWRAMSEIVLDPRKAAMLRPEDVTFELAIALYRSARKKELLETFFKAVFREHTPIVGMLKFAAGERFATVPYNQDELKKHLRQISVDYWSMPLPPRPDFVGLLLKATPEELASHRDLKKFASICLTNAVFVSTRPREWIKSRELRLNALIARGGTTPKKIRPTAPTSFVEKTYESDEQICAKVWDNLEAEFASFFKEYGSKPCILDYAPAAKQKLYQLLMRRSQLGESLQTIIAKEKRDFPKMHTVPDGIGLPSTNPSLIEQVSSLTTIRDVEIRGWPSYGPAVVKETRQPGSGRR